MLFNLVKSSGGTFLRITIGWEGIWIEEAVAVTPCFIFSSFEFLPFFRSENHIILEYHLTIYGEKMQNMRHLPAIEENIQYCETCHAKEGKYDTISLFLLYLGNRECV